MQLVTKGSHQTCRQIPITFVPQEIVVSAAPAALAERSIHLEGTGTANKVVVMQCHYERDAGVFENVED